MKHLYLGAILVAAISAGSLPAAALIFGGVHLAGEQAAINGPVAVVAPVPMTPEGKPVRVISLSEQSKVAPPDLVTLGAAELGSVPETKAAPEAPPPTAPIKGDDVRRSRAETIRMHPARQPLVGQSVPRPSKRIFAAGTLY
jgi:hypothetical protein